MKKDNKKGFTLAELLIVVAIIAVLVAIAIPVFTSQLERSREATDMSNVRAAYAEAVAEYLANGAKDETSATVTTIRQVNSGWQMGDDQAKLQTRVNGQESQVTVPNKVSGSSWTVHVSTSGSGTSVWVD